MASQDGRIVVAYDGSVSSAAAVDWAASEAVRCRARLVVLHVVDFLTTMPGPISSTSWPALTEEISQTVAREGGDRARKVGESIEITELAKLGQVSRTLINASIGADLLVVGIRRRGEIAGALTGTVAFTVSAHAKCPVVVVRGHSARLPGPQRPIVVGVDGSECSNAAIRYAADLASDTAAPLIVVSAYQPALLEAWAGILIDSVRMTDSRASLSVAAGRAMESVASDAMQVALDKHPDLSVNARILEGPAAAVLGQAALGAGMLVVGSRGHGGFAGLLLGSVSQLTLDLAPCPVTVVR